MRFQILPGYFISQLHPIQMRKLLDKLNVGLEWCNSQCVALLHMQNLSKYLSKVKGIDPATGKTLIGALNCNAKAI